MLAGSGLGPDPEVRIGPVLRVALLPERPCWARFCELPAAGHVLWADLKSLYLDEVCERHIHLLRDLLGHPRSLFFPLGAGPHLPTVARALQEEQARQAARMTVRDMRMGSVYTSTFGSAGPYGAGTAAGNFFQFFVRPGSSF